MSVFSASKSILIRHLYFRVDLTELLLIVIVTFIVAFPFLSILHHLDISYITIDMNISFRDHHVHVNAADP